MLRSIIATISLAQTLVIVSYFAYCFSSGPTVSSLLFSNLVYKCLLMVCVVLQLTLSFVYVCCHNGARVAPELLLVVAPVAWIVLNISHEDANGKILLEHLVAAGCFIVASGLYLIILFIETIYNEPMVSDLLCVSGGCIVFALVATIATVVCFFTNRTDTWIFEHTAFALFSATHALLFYIGIQNK